MCWLGLICEVTPNAYKHKLLVVYVVSNDTQIRQPFIRSCSILCRYLFIWNKTNVIVLPQMQSKHFKCQHISLLNEIILNILDLAEVSGQNFMDDEIEGSPKRMKTQGD